MKKRYYSSKEKGSVLLEFALVLPLYLFLFGMTMFLYELRFGELTVLQSNRMLAWAADDRNNDDDDALIAAVRTRLSDASLEANSNFRTWAKIMDSGALSSGGMNFIPENAWSRLYAGNVDPEMTSPKFYLGALNILSALAGKEESEFYLFRPRDLSYAGWDGNARDFNRASALICRRYTYDSPNPDFKLRTNTNTLRECPMEEIFATAQDGWLRAADTRVESVPATGQNSVAYAYSRITDSKITESESQE